MNREWKTTERNNGIYVEAKENEKMKEGKRIWKKGYNTTKPKGLRVIGRALFKTCDRNSLAILSATSPFVHANSGE
jgi:hypothetical protein